jgi:hypothetical protein
MLILANEHNLPVFQGLGVAEVRLMGESDSTVSHRQNLCVIGV